MGHEQKLKTWTALAYLVVLLTLPWVLFILGTALLYAVLATVHAPTWAWVVFWVFVPVRVLATLLREAVSRVPEPASVGDVLRILLVYEVLSAASIPIWAWVVFWLYFSMLVLNIVLRSSRKSAVSAGNGKITPIPGEQQPVAEPAAISKDQAAEDTKVAQGGLTLLATIALPLVTALGYAILSGINAATWIWIGFWVYVVWFFGSATVGAFLIAFVALSRREKGQAVPGQERSATPEQGEQTREATGNHHPDRDQV
jgi:hypothetical protein